MTKKYTYLVHIALFLAAMILLCLGFFLENPNGGLIAEQRAMPTCKEVQEVAEETRSDVAAPQRVSLYAGQQSDGKAADVLCYQQQYQGLYQRRTGL